MSLKQHLNRWIQLMHAQPSLVLKEIEVFLKSNPNPEVFNLQAAIFRSQGELDKAFSALKRALQRAPNNDQILLNLAVIQGDLGLWQESLKTAKKAQRKNPSAEALNQIGSAQLKLGQTEKAEKSFRDGIELNPKSPDLWNNLGIFYKQKGNWEPAETQFQKAISINSNYAPAWNNLGTVYLNQDLPQLAQNALGKACKLDPHLLEAWENLGTAYQFLGDTKNAAICYQKCAKLDPKNRLFKLRDLTVCPIIPSSSNAITSWRRRFEAKLERFEPIQIEPNTRLAHLQVPFHLVYQGASNLEMRKKYAQKFELPNPAFPKTTGCSKWGILVTSGHESVFLSCMAKLIEHLDAGDLTMICQAPGASRLKETLQNDKLNWLVIPHDFPSALEQIRRSQFDLVYFWEVGTDYFNYFLAMFRVAPAQVTSWGTSESTGLSQINGYIASQLWHPNPNLFSEKLNIMSEIPAGMEIPPKPEPVVLSEFGFDVSKPIFACPQSLFKIHPDFDDLMAEIQKGHPDVQWLFFEGTQSSWTDQMKARLEKSVSNPKIRFISRQTLPRFLGILKAATLVLDPPHFTGGLTSFQMLMSDIPILTQISDEIRSQFTAGYYRKMALLDLIAKNREDMLELVRKWLEDPAWREEIQFKIHKQKHLLIDYQSASEQFQAQIEEVINA